MILRGRPMVSPTIPSPNFTNRQKNQILHPLFLLTKQAQKKKLSKENAEKKFRALRSATVAADGSRKPFQRLDLNFN